MYSEGGDSEEEPRHSLGKNRFEEPDAWDDQDSQEYANQSDEDVAQQASPKRRKLLDSSAAVKASGKKVKVPAAEDTATGIQRKPCKKCEHHECVKNGMPSSDGQFFYCINHLREFGLQPRQRRNLCQHVGCNKWAQSSADGQYLYCTPHMRQHGLQPKFCCNHPGCQKWAQKNVDGRYLYCAAHMKEYGLQRCVTVKGADKDKGKAIDGSEADLRGWLDSKANPRPTKKQFLLNAPIPNSSPPSPKHPPEPQPPASATATATAFAVPKGRRTHRGRSTSSSSKQPDQKRAKWVSLSGKDAQASLSGSLRDTPSSGDEDGADTEVTGEPCRLTPSASTGSLVEAGRVNPQSKLTSPASNQHNSSGGSFPAPGRTTGSVRSRGGSAQRQGPRTRIPPAKAQRAAAVQGEDGWVGGDGAPSQGAGVHSAGTLHPAVKVEEPGSSPARGNTADTVDHEGQHAGQLMEARRDWYSGEGAPPGKSQPAGAGSRNGSKSQPPPAGSSPPCSAPSAGSKYTPFNSARKTPGNQRLEMHFSKRSTYDLNSLPDSNQKEPPSVSPLSNRTSSAATYSLMDTPVARSQPPPYSHQNGTDKAAHRQAYSAGSKSLGLSTGDAGGRQVQHTQPAGGSSARSSVARPLEELVPFGHCASAHPPVDAFDLYDSSMDGLNVPLAPRWEHRHAITQGNPPEWEAYSQQFMPGRKRARQRGERGAEHRADSRRAGSEPPTLPLATPDDAEAVNDKGEAPWALDQASTAVVQVTALVEDLHAVVDGCEAALRKLQDSLARDPVNGAGLGSANGSSGGLDADAPPRQPASNGGGGAAARPVRLPMLPAAAGPLALPDRIMGNGNGISHEQRHSPVLPTRSPVPQGGRDEDTGPAMSSSHGRFPPGSSLPSLSTQQLPPTSPTHIPQPPCSPGGSQLTHSPGRQLSSGRDAGQGSER